MKLLLSLFATLLISIFAPGPEYLVFGQEEGEGAGQEQSIPDVNLSLGGDIPIVGDPTLSVETVAEGPRISYHHGLSWTQRYFRTRKRERYSSKNSKWQDASRTNTRCQCRSITGKMYVWYRNI